MLLWLLFISFLLLILIGVDVGWSMILSAWFGIVMKSDRAVDTILLSQYMMARVNYYPFLHVPLSILAGEFG